MTRRRRHQGPNLLPLFALLAVVVAAVTLARLLPWLIAAAVIAVIGRYMANRQGSRPAQARPAELPEVTRLRAQVDQLEAELADARLARDAAWDAAANVPPRSRPAADSDEVTRLVSTPLSGVRRLGS